MPLVRPVTGSGDDLPVALSAPGLDVTVKPVMALPPVFAGALKLTLVPVLSAVAVPMVGAPGTVKGITSDQAEYASVPAALVVTTLKL